MNSTRQKRLFLLILTLVVVCPAIYCADHEEPAVFESNINLPLRGETIIYGDGIELYWRYAYLLAVVAGAAVVTPVFVAANPLWQKIYTKILWQKIYTMLNIILIKQPTPWLSSIVIQNIPYTNVSLIELAAATAFDLPFVYLALKIYWEVRDRSNNAIRQSWNLFNQARIRHNRAVSIGVHYEGMIVADDQENRTLLTRHDNEVGNYPFDRWRQDRQAAMSGLVNKILLGPGNLARILSIN